jgi:hypothetical protein
MSMIGTAIARNVPFNFTDQQGRQLPPRVNDAALSFMRANFGGANPSPDDARILKGHMKQNQNSGRRKVAPRQAKHYRRDAE